MLSAPSYNGTKVGAILYGLAAGVAMLVGIVSAATLLGILLAWFSVSTRWINFGDYNPWLPTMFFEYSIPQGIIAGVVVCWKIWKSRLWSARV